MPVVSMWKTQAKVNAEIEDGALHLADDSNDFGNYRAAWKAEPDQEIVVEAKVKVGAMTGARKDKGAGALWPCRDAAPIALQVTERRHQEGRVLFPTQPSSVP